MFLIPAHNRRMPLFVVLKSLKEVNFNLDKFEDNCYRRKVISVYELSYHIFDTIKEKYSDAKTRKSYMNYVEFGTNINCSLQEVVLSKDKLESKEKSEQKSTKGKIRKIQDYCVKIKVDRLGNIIEFNGLEL